MKMDTKIQAKENIFDKNQGFWIYNWWNSLKLILNWYGFGYIEPTHSQIFHIDISFERTRLVAERFIAYLIDKYGKHPISTDGGTCIIHRKHVSFYNWITIYIPFMRQALSEELCNISRINQRMLWWLFSMQKKEM